MRRIKKAAIKFISLCPAGANLIDTVYKTDGGVTFNTLVKAADKFDEEGEITAVVYAPNHRDAQGDIADATVVKQMAHDFIANGANIDISHDGKPVGRDRARVAETFLVQKGDARFVGWKDRKGQDVDLTGAWATVIKIDDPELRRKYRSGDWAGVSMGGTAEVEHEKAESALEKFLEILTKVTNPPTNPTTNETEMTPQELQTILDAQKTAMKEGFADLAKALKPEAPAVPVKKQDGPPELPEALWSNEKAVRKHLRDVELYELRKALLPHSPSEFLQAQTELRKAWTAEDAELKKASVGPATGGGDTPAPTHAFGGSGSALDAELLKVGAALAKSMTPAPAGK